MTSTHLFDSLFLRALILDSKDGEWGKGEPSEDSVEMAVIRGTDFEDARVGTTAGLPVRHIAMNAARRKVLQPHDILIETAGGSKDRPTGRTLFVKPSLISGSSLPLTCASFSRFIRIDQNRAEPRYIFWLLQHLYQSNVLRRYHTQHTGVARFQWTTFADNEVLRLPPHPVQRRIADILSAYDDLIETNARRIALLEELARSLYREWFVRFRFPGHEGVELVESAVGLVPEGWEAVPLASLVETQYGYTESASTVEVGPKFLRGMDINKTTYIQWENVPYCPINDSDLQKYRLKVGDLVVIRMADPGKVGIVERPIDAVFASYLIRLKPHSERVPPYYLFYFLISDRYQDFITGASTGTTRKSASAGVVTGIDLVVPPADLLEKFENQVREYRAMLNNLLIANANLRQTRDLLLPKLISGEVEAGETGEEEGNP